LKKDENYQKNRLTLWGALDNIFKHFAGITSQKGADLEN